jgi:hypothetical protein
VRDFLLTEGRIGMLMLSVPLLAAGLYSYSRAFRERDLTTGRAMLYGGMGLVALGVYGVVVALELQN